MVTNKTFSGKLVTDMCVFENRGVTRYTILAKDKLTFMCSRILVTTFLRLTLSSSGVELGDLSPNRDSCIHWNFETACLKINEHRFIFTRKNSRQKKMKTKLFRSSHRLIVTHCIVFNNMHTIGINPQLHMHHALDPKLIST